MTFTRRQLLVSGAALAAGSVLPLLSSALSNPPKPVSCGRYQRFDLGGSFVVNPHLADLIRDRCGYAMVGFIGSGGPT